jgi:hypothetical protein
LHRTQLLPDTGPDVRGERRDLRCFFDDARFELLDFIDADNRVVIMNLATGRGAGSGAQVEMPFSNVWTVRGEPSSA